MSAAPIPPAPAGSCRRSSSPPAHSATPAMADIGYPGDEARQESYMGRRFDPAISALLVNGRPIYLGLYDIQGYNPLHLSRYDEFMTALNGAPQDYHTAFLLPSGLRSPLLDLLDVRYIVQDAALATLSGRRPGPDGRDAGGVPHAAGDRLRARLGAAPRLDRARCASRDPRRGLATPDRWRRSIPTRPRSSRERRPSPPRPTTPRPSRHESPPTNRTG